MIKQAEEYFTLKNFLTTICIILTSYLLLQVVFNFAVTKPTSTSQEIVKFDAEVLPDIFICVDPAVDESVTSKYGYHDPLSYWLGRDSGWRGKFIGWNGRKGCENSSIIREKALTVKTEDKLVGNIGYLQDTTYESKNLTVDLKMLIYPYGRCQLVKPPRIKGISWISLILNSPTISKLTTEIQGDFSLNFLLMDPVNSPLVFPTNFQMKGSEMKVQLKTPSKKTLLKGWHPYLVKISQSRHVKDDPRYGCREYSLNDSYGNCVKKEWKGRFLKMLNCTPPMLLDSDTSQMCDKRFDLEPGEKSRKINELFLSQDFDSSSC